MYIAPSSDQLRVIEETEGYQRCAAVPGSGKTFCLTNRIAYLITELYIDPASIIGLTFTNKAAGSMRRRLKELVGDADNCFMGTFHGFCNLILKEESFHLNWPRAFTIIDQADQTDLVRQAAEDLGLSLKDMTAQKYLEDIQEFKLAHEDDYVPLMTGPDRAPLARLAGEAEDNFHKLLYSYMLLQRDHYLADFTDLIHMVLYLLRTDPEVLRTWQDRCMYVLCDEFQDVSRDQQELLTLLSGKYHNLFVIGDDDQNIYGWRGSKVEYMIGFTEHFPKAKDFPLYENFRSTPEIVAVANSLIGANKNRIRKKMFTNNPHGEKPAYNCLPSEREEALWIADQILSDIRFGHKWQDHAVLVRAASMTRALEEAFVDRKVPYKILSGARFYGSEEIRTVLAYLRMIYSLDDLDFEKTINHPRRGFGKKSLEKLKALSRAKDMKLIDGLGSMILDGTVRKGPLLEYYQGIMRLHAAFEKFSAAELTGKVLDLGYRKELQTDVDQRKLDNVSELVAAIDAMEKENEEPLRLEDLLAHFALFSGQDDDPDQDTVRIMTVHTAKGLEFDTVFVNGLVEGQFPSKKLTNQDEMEEERRLFYVAVTRARRMLYLSGYQSNSMYQSSRQSSFLQDIDPKLLTMIGSSYIGSPYPSRDILPRAEFAVGDTVRHKVFGRGKITGINEKSLTYDVDFEETEGIRRILFRAKMTKEP